MADGKVLIVEDEVLLAMLSSSLSPNRYSMAPKGGSSQAISMIRLISESNSYCMLLEMTFFNELYGAHSERY